MTDQDLLDQAMAAQADRRHLVAAQFIQQVQDQSLLTDEHRQILHVANMANQVKDKLLQVQPETDGWTRLTETHRQYDTAIYYKMEGSKLVCRIETPIEQSLLLPLLAVFNETELYKTWMPSFNRPRLGIIRSDKLAELDIGHQIISLLLQMPLRMSKREVLQETVATDSIDEDHAIIIKAKSLEPGKFNETITIPEPAEDVVRVDFDAGFMIRACPENHPLLKKSYVDYHNENKVLLSHCQSADAHVSYVPMFMINFVTKHVLGTMWSTLLEVAEEVRKGDRPQHTELMQEKADLYDWVNKRVERLFDNMKKTLGQTEEDEDGNFVQQENGHFVQEENDNATSEIEALPSMN